MSSMQKKLMAGMLLTLPVATLAVAHQSKPQQLLPVGTRQIAPPVALIPRQSAAQPAVQPYASAAIAGAIARWTSLRQTDGLPFSSYASFLTSYRGWPGEAVMRRTAERAIQPGITSPGEVTAFFRVHPALTPTGHARHAAALLASGRVEEARAAAQNAWRGGSLTSEDEARIISYFGAALGPVDHDARMDILLDNGAVEAARRIIPYASPARRAIYEARIALQSRAADAAMKLALAGPPGDGDAGLLLDRANWLRNTGQSAAARALLAQPRRLTALPADPEKFMEGVLAIARGAAADSQWTYAYQIASQLDDIFPAGTDVSSRSYGERDEYTSLAWLAGSTALQRIGRPADAIGLFDRYGRAAQSFQTRSKGFYWAGRAADRTGQAARAMPYFEQAAAYPDLFYGQLASERLGRTIAAPSPLPVIAASEPAAAAFEQNGLVQAIRYLGQQGRWSDQSLFIRTLSEQVASEPERILAGQLALRIGRPDLGVWVGRSSRNAGAAFYTSASFPQVRVPPTQAHNWALANAITRQESSFDRAAISHAGARGMMQLMPGTAREVAGKIGTGYDFGRLTGDPNYNVLLGSTYFASLLDQWGGSVPLAVASYNAGAGNVRKWIAANGDPRLPSVDTLRWIEEIPFSETRNYVQRVLENAVVYDLIDPNSRNGLRRNRLSFYLGESRQAG